MGRISCIYVEIERNAAVIPIIANDVKLCSVGNLVAYKAYQNVRLKLEIP